MRRALFFWLLVAAWLRPGLGLADARCPLADLPPPPIRSVDLPELKQALEAMQDDRGRSLWRTTPEREAELRAIFASIPQKTKLEQFYQLLYLIQRAVPETLLPVTVRPPYITNVLLAAKVFPDASFPEKIQAATVAPRDRFTPLWSVRFAAPEVRFPLNGGVGFASFESGKCQHAKELVFYDGFSFKVRRARNSKNLVVDDFYKVQLFGTFGAKKAFIDIDLSYVDLEKVEFIAGTDQGKVKARVARREFETNKHSRFFKFIGPLIPNTTRQRIDW